MEVYGSTTDSQTDTITKTNSSIILNNINVIYNGIIEKTAFSLNMFKEYKEHCLNGTLKMGELHIWKKEEQWILNFPTKIHFKDPSKMNNGLYNESFDLVRDEIKNFMIKFIKLELTR